MIKKVKPLGNRRGVDRLRALVRVRRVAFELVCPTLGDLTLGGHVLLNDFNGKSMGFFLGQKLPEGIDVIIRFKEPYALEVKARISGCMESMSNSHIVSENFFKYRLGAKFVFESPEQEVPVNEFVEKIFEGFLKLEQAA